MFLANRTHAGVALALAALACLGLAAAPKPRAFAKPAATYRVSGPHSHDNLAIFFLHGDDQIKDKTILTLDEALAAKKVIVHETKQVQKLAIENVSDHDVFVQAGDVVKGGQQDRTLTVDMIVPPKSGKVAIESFCVEQGRWNKRDGEDDKAFTSSKDQLVGNRLKLAARSFSSGRGQVQRGDQGQVWRNVGYAQSRLTENLKANVKDSKSETSYQLTLENKKLLDGIDAYVKNLSKSLDKKTDAIGYAVVINGKVTSADVYANAALFQKLWPKMLKCSAVEALVEKDAKLKYVAAKAADVTAFLAEPLKGKATSKAVTKEWKESQLETTKNVLFETRDDKDTVVLRRSYLAK